MTVSLPPFDPIPPLPTMSGDTHATVVDVATRAVAFLWPGEHDPCKHFIEHLWHAVNPTIDAPQRRTERDEALRSLRALRELPRYAADAPQRDTIIAALYGFLRGGSIKADLESIDRAMREIVADALTCGQPGPWRLPTFEGRSADVAIVDAAFWLFLDRLNFPGRGDASSAALDILSDQPNDVRRKRQLEYSLVAPPPCDDPQTRRVWTLLRDLLLPHDTTPSPRRKLLNAIAEEFSRHNPGEFNPRLHHTLVLQPSTSHAVSVTDIYNEALRFSRTFMSSGLAPASATARDFACQAAFRRERQNECSVILSNVSPVVCEDLRRIAVDAWKQLLLFQASCDERHTMELIRLVNDAAESMAQANPDHATRPFLLWYGHRGDATVEMLQSTVSRAIDTLWRTPDRKSRDGANARSAVAYRDSAIDRCEAQTRFAPRLREESAKATTDAERRAFGLLGDIVLYQSSQKETVAIENLNAALDEIAAAVAAPALPAGALEATAAEGDADTQAALDAITQLREAVAHADRVFGTNIYPWLNGIAYLADRVLLARDDESMSLAVEQARLHWIRQSEPIHSNTPRRLVTMVRATAAKVRNLVESRGSSRALFAKWTRLDAIAVEDLVTARESEKEITMEPTAPPVAHGAVTEADTCSMESALGNAYAAVRLIDHAYGTSLDTAARPAFVWALRVVNETDNAPLLRARQETADDVLVGFKQHIAGEVDRTYGRGEEDIASAVSTAYHMVEALRAVMRAPRDLAAFAALHCASHGMRQALADEALSNVETSHVVGACHALADAVRGADMHCGTRMSEWTQALLVVALRSIAPHSESDHGDIRKALAPLVSGSLQPSPKAMQGGFAAPLCNTVMYLVRHLTGENSLTIRHHIPRFVAGLHRATREVECIVGLRRAAGLAPSNADVALPPLDDLNRWCDVVLRANEAPSDPTAETPMEPCVLTVKHGRALESSIGRAYAAVTLFDHSFLTGLYGGSKDAFVTALHVATSVTQRDVEAAQKKGAVALEAFRERIEREIEVARRDGSEATAEALSSARPMLTALGTCIRTPLATDCVGRLDDATFVMLSKRPPAPIVRRTPRDLVAACFALDSAVRGAELTCGLRMSAWTQALLVVALRAFAPHSADEREATIKKLQELRETMLSDEDMRGGFEWMLRDLLLDDVRMLVNAPTPKQRGSMRGFVSSLYHYIAVIRHIAALRTHAGVAQPSPLDTPHSTDDLARWSEVIIAANVADIEDPESTPETPAMQAAEEPAPVAPLLAPATIVGRAASAAQLRIAVRQCQRLTQATLARGVEAVAGPGAAAAIVRTEAFGALAAALGAVAASRAGADHVAEELATQALTSLGGMALDVFGGPLVEALAPIAAAEHAQEILPGLPPPRESFAPPWTSEHFAEPGRINSATASHDPEEE